MKAFELTMKLKNNLIKRRRLDLGLSCREAAEAAGVNYGLWLKYEAMTFSPLSSELGRTGRWRPSALAVAKFFGMAPEDLFPDAVLMVVAPEQVREIDAEEAMALGQMQYELAAILPPQPDEQLDRERAKEAVRGAIQKLSPRQRTVLKLRFEEDLTLDEAGERLGVGRERIRQIESKALRTLRSPWRREGMEEFDPGATS